MRRWNNIICPLLSFFDLLPLTQSLFRVLVPYPTQASTSSRGRRVPETDRTLQDCTVRGKYFTGKNARTLPAQIEPRASRQDKTSCSSTTSTSITESIVYSRVFKSHAGQRFEERFNSFCLPPTTIINGHTHTHTHDLLFLVVSLLVVVRISFFSYHLKNKSPNTHSPTQIPTYLFSPQKAPLLSL